MRFVYALLFKLSPQSAKPPANSAALCLSDRQEYAKVSEFMEGNDLQVRCITWTPKKTYAICTGPGTFTGPAQFG